MAAVATAVLLATGLYESGRHLPDLNSVFSTIYGGAVAGKVILVAVALLLAGFNTLLINPGLAAPVGRILRRPVGWAPVSLHRFTTVVAAEAVILVVAVGAAALLTSVPTSREVETAARETTVHSDNVDGLFITFEEVPAGADESRLIVRTRSTDKPERGPISGVSVLLAGPSGTTTNVSLNSIEPGRYETETARLIPGSWQASVAVQRDNVPEALTQVQWTVPAAIPEGARPLEVATTGLAILLLAAVASAVWLVRRRREHPTLTDQLVHEKTGRQR